MKFVCDHCGRTAGDFAGGGSGMSNDTGNYRFCHPNVEGRPDCYRLVTVYLEEIGSRKPGQPNENEPDWSVPTSAPRGEQQRQAIERVVTEMTRRVTVYTKPSRDAEGPTESSEAQRLACERYAAENGWEIVQPVPDTTDPGED